jgi:hypothetical protein
MYIFYNKLEALPPHQRSVLHKVAAWISAVIVNVKLREILCLPLVRDQLQVLLKEGERGRGERGVFF